MILSRKLKLRLIQAGAICAFRTTPWRWTHGFTSSVAGWCLDHTEKIMVSDSYLRHINNVRDRHSFSSSLGFIWVSHVLKCLLIHQTNLTRHLTVGCQIQHPVGVNCGFYFHTNYGLQVACYCYASLWKTFSIKHWEYHFVNNEFRLAPSWSYVMFLKGLFVVLWTGKSYYDKLVVSTFSTNLFSLTAYTCRNAANVIWIYLKMMFRRCWCIGAARVSVSKPSEGN